ncbi:desumoylating isopeptidase 2-like [Gossypium australe]|uniref:Desumoylating isopeptidase 2-like n=1 Tax=Gossypium australe TaxID=47621 RepID=A0A5B6VLF2_9ROSI|nr:desumoylating isopeptidase 2-like [Gossypium australe]
MAEVILHIYDVTNSGSDKTNNTIVHINKIFKDRIGLGGIFHSAIQVYGDDEWSFGFCEQGSGVFCCPSRKNPLYTYREFMVLGRTNSSIFKVNQILRELSREWPGTSYDLLSKNCNHFCDELCERLGVQKLPGWVNRFANTGDAAIEMAENTALRFKQAKTEIVSASKVAYRFLVGVTSGSTGGDNPPRNSNSGSPRFQSAWFKNLITAGAKPSNSSEIETQEGDVVLQHQRQQNSAHTLQQTCHNSERPLRQSSHQLEQTLRHNSL